MPEQRLAPPGDIIFVVIKSRGVEEILDVGRPWVCEVGVATTRAVEHKRI